MILLLVGTQAPFERLVRAVDDWSSVSGRPEVVAQVGRSSYTPRYLRHTEFMTPVECRQLTAQADLVVAHAGMGTILGALELGKPCVVMPRRADLGEHRNDHQLATADRLGRLGLVTVANTPERLVEAMERHVAGATVARIRPFAQEPLIEGLRRFLTETAGGVR